MNLSLSTSRTTGDGPGRPGDIPAGRGPWRVGVISNPRSGGNRRGGMKGIRRFLQHHPDIPHREACSVKEVQATLADFARNNLNLVVVNSGDGTIQAALTVLFNRREFQPLPVLALLCGGTTNMTHQDLGLRGPRVAALQRLVNWVHHGEGEALVRRRSILKVQTPFGPHPLYGLFFGAACIFKGIQFFHSRVHRMGLSGDPAHLVILARFLWALARRQDALVAPVPTTIRTDRSAAVSKDLLLLLITTLDRLILGVRPFWGRGSGPLRVTAVGARPQRLLCALPALIHGRGHSCATARNGYLSCNAREVQLDMDAGFAIDGELFTADRRSGPVLIQDGGVADFLRV